MASPPSRRPMPALIALLVLSLLTTLVWWRVIHRSDTHSAAPTATCTPTPKASSPPSASSGASRGPTLAVLNSTTRTGLAATAASELQKAGFVVTKIDNVTPTFPQIAQIKYAQADITTAQKVATLISGATLSPTGSSGVVEIDLGTQFKSVSAASSASTASASSC